MKKLLIVFSFFLLFTGVFTARAQASTVNLSGAAWSDQYGWISFNCISDGSCGNADYKASVDSVTGLLSGQAWSDTLGWVTFPSSGCPSGTCQAKLNLTTWKLTGWAKLETANQWIQLAPSSGTTYGVTYDQVSKFSGTAWSDYAGWLKFQGSNYAVKTDSCITNCNTIPAAPSNLTATADSQTQITLNWTDNSNNEDYFVIQRKTSVNGNYGDLSPWLPTNTTTYPNSNLTNNTTYYYRVRAVNTIGNSAYSNETSATTGNNKCPAAPTIISAVALSQTSIKITWTNNDTIQNGNVLQRAPSSNGPWATAASSLQPQATTFTDSGLTKGTTYYYKLYATGSNCNSSDSNIASAATPTTTTINVTTSPSVGWTIKNDHDTTQIYMTGNQAVTVNPDPAGTIYTITGDILNNYKWPPDSSCDYGDNGGAHSPCSKLVLVGGEDAAFILNYSPTLCANGGTPPCPPINLNYSLSPASQSLSIRKAGGEAQSDSVVITKTYISGQSGTVGLDVVGNLPTGISVQYVPISSRDCTPTCSTTVQFTVQPTAVVQDDVITFAGTPVPSGGGNNSAKVTLHVLAPSGVLVTCAVNPTHVEVNQNATWSVTHKEGGNGNYISTEWLSGSSVVASGDTFITSYSTSGTKSMRARVTDSVGNVGYCTTVNLGVGTSPGFEEF